MGRATATCVALLAVACGGRLIGSQGWEDDSGVEPVESGAVATGGAPGRGSGGAEPATGGASSGGTGGAPWTPPDAGMGTPTHGWDCTQWEDSCTCTRMGSDFPGAGYCPQQPCCLTSLVSTSGPEPNACTCQPLEGAQCSEFIERLGFQSVRTSSCPPPP